MAKYQYTINGTLQGVSSPANATLALLNKQGSGKRITLRQLTVRPLRTSDTAGGVAVAFAELSYGTVTDGNPLSVVGMDSAATWPSGIALAVDGQVSGTSRVVSRHQIGEGYAATMLGELVRGKLGGNRWRALRPTARRGTGAIECLAVRPGESLAMRLTWANRAFYRRVSMLLRVRGTPNRTFVSYGHAFVNSVGNAIWSIVNTSASDIVELLEWGFEEYGEGASTPYMQLVPIINANPAVAGTASNSLPITKKDSAYPDPGGWLYALADTPVTALGVPDEYIAQGSALTPKGFSYLGTKDFVGPVYRSFFPELDSTKVSLSAPAQNSPSDYFASVAHDALIDLNVQKAGIVLREGDGVALTPAVETAYNAVAALSPGSQRPLRYSVTFDVENASQPYLTINGLVAGSDIVVLDAGTANILQQIDAYSGTSWSWAYDQDTVLNADVAIYQPGYIPRTFRNVPLGTVGASIIASQQVDRNYS